MPINDKLRKARIVNGWTQAQFATIVGLAVPRIKQYESGARTPSPEQLDVFIKALGVSEEYFHEHSVDTQHDVMHALFELEDTFGIDLVERNGTFLIEIKNPAINDYLKAWKQEKDHSSISTETKEKYFEWKMRFPKDKIAETTAKLDKIRNKDKE
jgi:transcriptional regulator with XRE-family HTH domain